MPGGWRAGSGIGPKRSSVQRPALLGRLTARGSTDSLGEQVVVDYLPGVRALEGD